MAMSAAERQRKRRAKLKAESLKPLLVRGSNGEFDERIRVALAVRELAIEGKLSNEIVDLIVDKSVTVLKGTESDLSTKKYIRKIVANYLAN